MVPAVEAGSCRETGALVGAVTGAVVGALVGVCRWVQPVDPMMVWAQWRCDRWMQWRCDWIWCLFVFMWLVCQMCGGLILWSMSHVAVEVNERQAECVNDHHM